MYPVLIILVYRYLPDDTAALLSTGSSLVSDGATCGEDSDPDGETCGGDSDEQPTEIDTECYSIS